MTIASTLADTRLLVAGVLAVLLLGLALGLGALALHGWLLVRCRPHKTCNSCEWLPAWPLAALAAIFLVLVLLNLTGFWPLLAIDTAPLLLAVAPLLLHLMGPPMEHMNDIQRLQIGTMCAWNHYYGYLRLMRGDNDVHKRLRNCCSQHSADSDATDGTERLETSAVFVLFPCTGRYPENDNFDELLGIGKRIRTMDQFTDEVGGNTRTYGAFKVHEVTSLDGKDSAVVALDSVGALKTLRRLRLHGPANMNYIDFSEQRDQLLEKLLKIIAIHDHVCNKVKLVTYNPGEHVGNNILNVLRDRK